MIEGVTVSVTPGVTLDSERNVAKQSAQKRQISVERLLHWAYGIERVRGMPSWSEGSGGGVSGARAGCHDDALTVDQVVNGLSSAGAALVRDHGVAGTRPDWKPQARYRMAPTKWKVVEGEHVAGEWYESHPSACRCGGWAHLCSAKVVPAWPRALRNRYFERSGIYVPIVEVDRPRDLDGVRTIYVNWWAALKVIRDVLLEGRVVLAAHAVTHALPPLAPWNGSKEGAVGIIHVAQTSPLTGR